MGNIVTVEVHYWIRNRITVSQCGSATIKIKKYIYKYLKDRGWDLAELLERLATMTKSQQPWIRSQHPWHSWIWGASDETVLNKVFQKSTKSHSKCSRLHLLYYRKKYNKFLFPLTSRFTSNRYIWPCPNVTSDKRL